MFYDVFLSLCKEKNVKPSRALMDAGLPKSAASYWKNKYDSGEDAKPSSENAAKLAGYFGVTVDYLLTGEQKEKPTALGGDGINDVNLSKLSPARQKLLEAVNGMTDDKIMALLRVIEAVNREMLE